MSIRPIDPYPEAIVHDDGYDHENDVPRLPPGVEDQAEDQENSIFISKRNSKIEGKDKRQKEKQKTDGTEDQSNFLLVSAIQLFALTNMEKLMKVDWEAFMSLLAFYW